MRQPFAVLAGWRGRDGMGRRLRSRRSLARAAIMLLITVLRTASTADAQTANADTLSRGRIVPVVVSRSDTAERYALYLPTRYNGSRAWPALLVMDPRGRALVGARLFQEAAERDGYIVLSSYNTVSDSTEEPNDLALNAMLREIETRYTVDVHRVYLAGFSGTARLAWGFVGQLNGHVAGLVGFGAALPWSGPKALVQLHSLPRLAFFGGAGTLDFNYDEVTTLDATLDLMPSISHRVIFYPGPHSWPPASVCGAALDWMQLQAMRAGLTTVDDSVVQAQYAARLAAARAATDAGDVYTSWHEYRSIVADFTGLHDVTSATTALATLSGSADLSRAVDRRQRLRDAHAAYTTHVLFPYLARVEHDSHPPSTAAAVRELDLVSLQRRAADTTDRADADAAQRTLNDVRTAVSFYQPRRYFAAHDPARAVALLLVARAMQPADPSDCWWLARGYALLGQRADALEALRCASARGSGLTAADVRGDSAFVNWRDDPQFREIVATLPDEP
jgi:predicted esterase